MLKQILVPVGVFALFALAGYTFSSGDAERVEVPFPGVFDTFPDLPQGSFKASGPGPVGAGPEEGGGGPVTVVQVIPEGGIGTIEGVIRFKGDFETLANFSFGVEESEGCGEVPTEDRSLLVDGNGGISNVVVSLKAKGFTVAIPAEPVVLDQMSCRYEPHVRVVPVGTTVRFQNSDGTNHNVHTYARKNQTQNRTLSAGQYFDQVLTEREVFESKCDIHPWMKAQVVVTTDTHFAVTNVAGEFRLEDVPSGKYKLKLWHEKLGKAKTADVVVLDGKIASVAHEMTAKKRK